MNVLSLTTEAWNDLFQLASIVAGVITLVSGALTFAVLVGTVVTGRRVNKQQAERMATLSGAVVAAQRRLAEQQERAAKAELALEEVKRRQQPRQFLPLRNALEALANAPGEAVDIMYPDQDWESANLARQIAFMLGAAHWKVKEPTPYKGEGYGVSGDDVIIASHSTRDFLFLREGTPLAALIRALESQHLKVWMDFDAKLPPNSFHIVVARKS